MSDVLRDARQAAARGAHATKEATAEMSQRMRSAEERAAKAIAERDAAMSRVAAAESARLETSNTLKDMERKLASAEETLERQKREAAHVLGQLDDAYEFEQQRVQAMRQLVEEQKRALKKAEREANLAAAREATASADAAAVKREKTEVETRLEEERLLLQGSLNEVQGSLATVQGERDALMFRALAAEAKVGRKRRAVRSFVSASSSRLRRVASRLHSLRGDIVRGRLRTARKGGVVDLSRVVASV